MKNYSIEKVKQTFLNDDLLTKKSKPEIYSLPEEFAKSKRNRSYLVYGMILLYISAIGFGVYLLTSAEEQKNKRVEVNIAEFKQFNLDELLEKKREDEQKLAELQKELAKVKAESLEQIRKLTPEEQRKAMAELNQKLQRLEEEYKSEVNQNKKTLKQLQKSVAREQKRSEKKTREAEKLAEDYQKLTEKNKENLQKITESYDKKIAKLQAEFNKELEDLVARYNPTFSKGKIAAVLDSNFEFSQKDFWNKYNKTLVKNGIINQQQLDGLHQKIQSQTVIIESLQEIGFINSIPLALNKLQQISSSIISDYEAICEKLMGLIDQKNKKTDSMEYALNYLVQNNGADGFVLDTRQSAQLIIYLKENAPVASGDLAQIFKNNDDSVPIAEIRLYPGNGLITAKINKRFGSAKIEPYDKVLLKTK